MSIQVQVDLRSRKLGVLIRDARIAERMTLRDTANLVGITSGIMRAWEEGRRAPSLPELEVLAFSLHLPMTHFWGKDTMSEEVSSSETINVPALISVRQRLVGVLLRQQRENTSLSLRALSEESGIPTSRLKAYEMGDRPIPLPELEGLLSLLGGQIEKFFDQTGPIGKWMQQQKAISDFLELSPELQSFVSKPVNRPYLELAMKLSSMSTDKLRSVAEGLLDITF